MTRHAHCDLQERVALGVDNELPAHFMETVSNTYVGLAEKITGQVSPRSQPPTACRWCIFARSEIGRWFTKPGSGQQSHLSAFS
jgi:hypothetical protein